MIKPDDCSLSAHDLKEVQKFADRLLLEADCYGVYPTPIDDLIAAAQLSIDREVSLDEGFLKRIYKKVVPTAIKRAVEKVIGLFDSRDRRIYLDQTVHDRKKPFVSLHEAGHGYLPWQRDTFAVMEDCKKTLDPEIIEEFEKEANVFSSEVLFQGKHFTELARDHPFELKTVRTLATKFGGSVYAAARRFVSTNPSPCVLLVVDLPVYEIGSGYTAALRRSVTSPSFTARYGDVKWKEKYGIEDSLMKVLPFHNNHKITKQTALNIRLNGESETFIVEAFNSSYEIFVLLCPASVLKEKKRIVA
jgi:Zn-dependent peptidase ImmA (M78 family)